MKVWLQSLYFILIWFRSWLPWLFCGHLFFGLVGPFNWIWGIYTTFHVAVLIFNSNIFCILFKKLDEAAVQKVFLKSLENYIKWCKYLCLQPVWTKWGFEPFLIYFVAFNCFHFYFWPVIIYLLYCVVWKQLARKRSCSSFLCTSWFGVKHLTSDFFQNACATYFIT